MKNPNSFLLSTLLIFSIIAIMMTCKKDEEKIETDIWDIDKQGIPQFVNVNYIDLSKIYRISKFRSSIGHDYSDAFEHCRSMKHYFEPGTNVDWSSVDIYSPVSGEITRVEEEWAGTKLEIESEAYPAFRFQIFHIHLDSIKNIGDKIHAGDHLGKHIGRETYSDVSVIVNDPTRQGRFVSYFDVITDPVFNLYINRGILNRSDVIISKEGRDAHPLICNGDQFISIDSLESWVYLK